MKNPKIFNGLKKIILLTICSLLIPVTQTFAEDLQGDGELHFMAEIYAWAPAVDGHGANGTKFSVDFQDIWDNLNTGGMGDLAFRKDNFWLIADALYLDLEDDPGKILSNVQLKQWLVTPAAAYTIFEGELGRFDVLAGARMLYMDTSVTLQGPNRQFDFSGSDTNWDAIGGFRGKIDLPFENFALPYYFDIGGGDSDLTTQSIGGLGYEFGNCNVIAGYRYLHYQFKSGTALDDMDVKGPYVAVNYKFF